MTLEELLRLEPTLSENNSQKLFAELLNVADWRCYSSMLTNETESLVQRFLQSHAKMPGIVTEEMTAIAPIDVFAYHVESNGTRVFGANFLNGAVVQIVNPKINYNTQLLMVSESTAQTWHYPDDPAMYRRLGAADG